MAPVAVNFYAGDEDEPDRVRVALYHLHGPIPLSRRVPILENLGFAVIDERSYRIVPQVSAERVEAAANLPFSYTSSTAMPSILGSAV